MYLRQNVRLMALSILLFLSSAITEAQAVENPRLTSAQVHEILTSRIKDAPMPSDVATLDKLWSRQDLARLTARLRDVSNIKDAWLDMNWEKARILDGDGLIIVYAYMTDLWRLGATTRASDGEGLKQAAGMMLAYGIDLIILDGLRCADPSAPVHRRDQLMTQNPELIRFIANSPKSVRMSMGTISLAFEAATAPLRHNDEVLCSGGLSQISAGLKAQGDKPLVQSPSAPGMIGKTYQVPAPPGYKPEFVGEQIWRPKQNQARATMAALLTKLLTMPSDSQQGETSSPEVGNKH